MYRFSRLISSFDNAHNDLNKKSLQKIIWLYQVGKIAEKAVCSVVYFWQYGTVFWQKRTPSDCFFDDFAHWVIQREIQ